MGILSLSLCLALVVINARRKNERHKGNDKRQIGCRKCDEVSHDGSMFGGQGWSNRERTGEAPHAGRLEVENGARRTIAGVESGEGFLLYDGADIEPPIPPMELCDDVLSMLASFDVDPVRGEPTATQQNI